MSENAKSLEEAKAAKQKLREHFADCSALRGIGLTRRDGMYAVKVNFSEIPAEHGIPADVDGVPVIIDVVGTIRPR